MGGHHSQHSNAGGPGSGDTGGSGTSTPRGGSKRDISRSASGADLQEKAQVPSFIPVEKLSKLLLQRSLKEDGLSAVTERSFTKYLFPAYPELATRVFDHMARASRCKNHHLSGAAFRSQCERLLGLLDDAAIIDTYVSMFSEAEEGIVSPEGLRSLLYTSYKLSMDHYPDGPQTCLMINKTLAAVVDGCFHNKDSHSVGFVVRWLEQHCHRLIFPVHRYCVHMLGTRHRDLEAHLASVGSEAGLGLATPVLERAVCRRDGLLPLSAAWLLAGTAPHIFSTPLNEMHGSGGGGAAGGGGSMSSRLWLARLVCVVPSHWLPLYSSREHGNGFNRFTHHTLGYRGATLVLFQAEERVVVVCSSMEWKESHQYRGDENCALIQLLPTFEIIERGSKMLYLNTSIRGYPKGLRAGTDPRKPLLSINEDFDQISIQQVPYALRAVEVWGCGDVSSREVQLEIKKWQVREAERQRQVKLSAADWMEHPDRYLLELAGRPQYNTSAS